MNDIYEYIKSEEGKFDTQEVQVGNNWFWNFKNHVQLIFHLKNGVFFTGANDWLRAFKNIMEPILELCYWTEDLEVKDVVFTIDEDKALSFLIKKYHDEIYVKEHDLDSMFDEITESDLDYGGVLVQKGVDKPEVLPLQSVAFCDQTDIMGGPIFFKHNFSPSKLKKMSKLGWGEEKNGADITLEELCVLAEMTKDAGVTNNKQNQVPGKTIEVYIGRGDMPEDYLEDNGEIDYYCSQIQIRAFYTKKDGNKQGVCLYRKREEEGNLMFFTSKAVYLRALGRGIGERLVGPQIWTNFLTIHKTSMLEAGAKTPLVTDDPAFSNRNKIQDMENNELTVIAEGATIKPIQTISPNNIQLYEKSINEWYDHAQLTGAAFDPIMGEQPVSGTTFRGQERNVAQGRGSHDKRKGQRAKFIEAIYRKLIIPDIVKEILKGKKFLATLSTEEIMWVATQMSTKAVNKRITDIMLNKGGMFNGHLMTEEDKHTMMQVFKDSVLKKGNRQLVEILKDEFKDIEIKIGINVAGKQKNLANLSDKILSIFQFIFANPQGFQNAMQVPALAKAFEDILELSGLSVADFSSLLQAPAMIPSPIQMQGQMQGKSPQLALNET